jgi:hypothetical protein
MQRQLTRNSERSLVRGVIAGTLCAAFFSILALSASPQWHELLHRDAKSAQHECAVTLVGSGKIQQPVHTPLVVAPAPALLFAFIPALRPVWVASPFFGARVFEHAPPTRA